MIMNTFPRPFHASHFAKIPKVLSLLGVFSLVLGTCHSMVPWSPNQPMLVASPAVDARLTEEERRTVAVYQRANPAVVHITTLSTTLDEAYNAQEQGGIGSGVIIDKRGYFITNYHVIQGIDALMVMIPGHEEAYPAELIGQEPSLDLAVMKIQPPKAMSFPTIPIGHSDTLTVGQEALTIGSPLGLQGTLTKGVISSVNRPVPLGSRTVGMLQIDASINPGNSGGALLNSSGELIGINTLGLLPGDSSTGLNFALPITPLMRYVDDFIQHGGVQRPYLGVTLGLEVTPDVAKMLELKVNHGVMIETVDALSPAEKAGLRGGNSLVNTEDGQTYRLGGDVMTEFNGIAISSTDQLLAAMEACQPGQTIQLGVSPGGVEAVQYIHIVLGKP
jgi:S1-C subfamily serine protease